MQGASLEAVTNELSVQCDRAIKGDLGRCEAFLVTQTHTLDSIYTWLVKKALKHLDNMDMFERLMRLGLKAQSQCRATVESLANVKNPPLFAKQANIAHGHQQVNNNAIEPPARAEAQIEQSKLLRYDGESERLDSGAQGPAKRRHTKVAAVATINRPAHHGRKGHR